MTTRGVYAVSSNKNAYDGERISPRKHKMDIFQRKTSELMPPYGAYPTHLETLARVHPDDMPAKLRPNAKLQGSLTDTVFSQIIRGWRFFGLANVNEEPEELLVRLISAEGEQRRGILRGIVETSYNFLFDPSANPLNLAEATSEELRQRFEQQGMTGSTVRRSMLFFTRMAQDAGILLSAELVGEQGAVTQERLPPVRQVGGKASVNGRLTDRKDSIKLDPKPPVHDKTIGELLLAKLPDYVSTWSPERQAQWFESFNTVLSIIAREKKPGA